MSTADSVDSAAARAETLIELDRHADAVPLLMQALAAAPDEPWLLDLLTQAQLETDPEAAFRTAVQFASVAPESHRPYLLASFAARRLGRDRAEEVNARAAVERAPWLTYAHAQLAQSLVDRGRKLKEAMRAAQTSIELAPDAPVGYVTAGNVMLRRGKTREAHRYYERALEVDPTNRAAQTNVAIANRARGRLNRAFVDADTILRLDPRDDGARRVLDETVYTTLVHLQWVAFAIAVGVAMWRIG